MKTKLFFLPLLALTASLAANAQQVENDDVYFTAKDRAKAKEAVTASLSTNSDIVARGIRITDQYSGRSVNPEYASRLNTNPNTKQGSDNPYFDSNYQPSNTNSGYGNNYYNNSFYGNGFNNPYNSWNNPMYSNMYGYSGMYGNSMYGFGSPYNSFYSSFYSPYGYSSGLSFGLGFGSGFYSPYSSFYGYNSMMYGYGGMGGYYGGYPYYGYGYPGTVIINNGGGDNGSNIVYGRRGSRSNAVDNSSISSGRGTGSAGSVQNQNGQLTPIGGRTNGGNNAQQYYQPNWRNNPDVNTSSTGRQSGGSAMDRSQSLGTQNPSWNNGNSRQSQSPSWNGGNSRQSSFPTNNNNNFGTPSRGGSSTPSWNGGGGFGGGGSMGGGGGHSSGGGGSRGR